MRPVMTWARYDMTDGALQVSEDTNLEGLRMEQIDLFDAPAPPERKRQEEAAPDDGLDEMLATSARKTEGFPLLFDHGHPALDASFFDRDFNEASHGE